MNTNVWKVHCLNVASDCGAQVYRTFLLSLNERFWQLYLYQACLHCLSMKLNSLSASLSVVTALCLCGAAKWLKAEKGHKWLQLPGSWWVFFSDTVKRERSWHNNIHHELLWSKGCLRCSNVSRHLEPVEEPPMINLSQSYGKWICIYIALF